MAKKSPKRVAGPYYSAAAQVVSERMAMTPARKILAELSSVVDSAERAVDQFYGADGSTAHDGPGPFGGAGVAFALRDPFRALLERFGNTIGAPNVQLCNLSVAQNIIVRGLHDAAATILTSAESRQEAPPPDAILRFRRAVAAFRAELERDDAPRKDTPAVQLGKTHKDPVFVFGKEKPPLSRPRYRIIEALVKVFPDTLPKDRLTGKTNGGAINTLKAIARIDDDWARAIRLAGTVGGGYGLNPARQ